MMASMYRPDIDGLRAVAILCVVGYHFFPGLFPAGFVGVDVFFVVSGFLITGILLDSKAAGSDWLIDFYARRVRRIFPALAVVLVTVIAAGWFWLNPREFAQLGRHVAGGAGFVANLTLWQESGYFNAAIESKPLAHLWSLGVEEQFYLLWPLLLWALWRWRFNAMVLVASLSAVSLAAGWWVLAYSRDAAFYLPIFRFWELMAGGWLALLQRQPGREPLSQSVRESLAIAGVMLLVAGLVLIRPAGFPGGWALLPVAGTAMLIAAGPGTRTARWFLANRVMAGIGLISFSLYLWHWPLITFSRLLFNAEPRLPGALILIAASFGLAWLTFRFVEQPARHGAQPRRVAQVMAVTVTAIGLAGWIVSVESGFPSRGVKAPGDRDLFGFPDRWTIDDCRLPAGSDASVVRFCKRDAREAERFALVGDSKAEALFAGLLNTSLPEGRWLFIGGASHHGQLIPVLSDAPAFHGSQEASKLALRAIESNPHVRTIVVATAARALFRLDYYIDGLPGSPHGEAAREGLVRFTRRLLDAGKEVVLLVDNPTLPPPAACLEHPRIRLPQPWAGWFGADGPNPRCQLPIARHRELSARYHQLLRDVRSMDSERISIFETEGLLCNEQRGVCEMTDGRHTLYWNGDHISAYAALRIGRALNESLLARSVVPAQPSSPPASRP